VTRQRPQLHAETSQR